MTTSNLATGSQLTPETFNNFIERLKHDCVGAGVDEHHTADAIFRVEARKLVYGIDRKYTDKIAIICDESVWHSVSEYLAECSEATLEQLNQKSMVLNEKQFADLNAFDQVYVLGQLDDHTITGWDEKWEHVNSHFTQAAADAFIKRKSHDYRDGMRVYVDAQLYCWEWNAIKEALINGSLVLKEPEPEKTCDATQKHED